MRVGRRSFDDLLGESHNTSSPLSVDMIIHIVLFKFKEGTSEEEIE